MKCSPRFAYSYEGEDLVKRSLELSSEKIHYPIFHDETCFQANDQDNYVWMREGEQPLWSKSRGRIIHVSDFIIEACRCLCLNLEEIATQMKLPQHPKAPFTASSSSQAHYTALDSETPIYSNQLPMALTNKGQRKPRKKASNSSTLKEKTGVGHTFTEHENEYIPPPPPAPFTSYRVSSFDARRIIYPGSNYDPWWDMSQLITQVNSYNAYKICSDH
jgi:hypothetical protein